VTGAGVVTSLGCGWRENAEGFRAGRVGLREVTLFDTTRQRVRHAGEVALPGELPAGHRLGRRDVARLDRATVLLLHAAAEAWRQAGWGETGDAARPGRVPVVLGTSAGAMALGEEFYRRAVAGGSLAGQAARAECYQPVRQVLVVMRALGFDGPATLVSNACASGANAVGQAFLEVRSGRAPRVLCGGYDALSQLVFAGFDSLQALSPGAPRPFDEHRDGLALGEGAAVLALERRDLAEARGATVLGEILGYGVATDLHHLTQPHPDGDAALASMREAAADAGVAPGQVGYVNAHGTGTPLNDAAEARAINRFAGEAAGRIPVSSTKASVGHLLGAAGAVEAAACLMALDGGWIPPSATTRTPDPACGFDLVREPRAAGLGVAMSNSFGFGGANATLVIGGR
jgi:3-oxoacyl-[acyl-carrier-protein] synthase II